MPPTLNPVTTVGIKGRTREKVCLPYRNLQKRKGERDRQVRRRFERGVGERERERRKGEKKKC